MPVRNEYNLDTIGVRGFLSPPPTIDIDTMLIGEGGESQTRTFKTWEIVGNIKTYPEDFIVREIGGIPRDQLGASISIGTGTGGSQAKTAYLTDFLTLPNDDGDDGNGVVTKKLKTGVASVSSSNSDQVISSVVVQNQKDGSEDTPGSYVTTEKDEDEDDDDVNPIVHYEESPKDVVKRILVKCIQYHLNDGDNHNLAGMQFYQQLENLSNDAMSELLKNKNKLDDDNASVSIDGNVTKQRIVIPPFTDRELVKQIGEEASSPSRGFRNRATFHRKMKILFPLLKSSTLSEEDSKVEWKNRKTYKNTSAVQDQESYDGHSFGSGRYVVVEKDESFHGLIPYLLRPDRDLPLLYAFRNRGCTGISSLKQGLQGKIRKSKHLRGSSLDRDMTKDASKPIMLYLKPNTEREKRKDVHCMISKMYRDFETGTKNYLPCEDGGNKFTTSAITVQWSKKAQTSWLKRKRKELSISSSDSSGGITGGKGQHPHTLCVLKKRRQEHLSAVNHLVAALKVRQSDIGLAGIKDMQAVTYQFCTIRNTSPAKVRRANEYLKNKNMEVGNFECVDWLLNQGSLRANHFELIVRDLKRVEIRMTKNGMEEKFIPCGISHIENMVARVRQKGFINFFGEQRCGKAGPREQVGVRADEIGKAMLKGEFLEAINLLLMGRGKRRNGEYIENEKTRFMRETYASTGGDPVATLQAFPRSDALNRERTVLQGLKRYGKSRPLEALKCLHFNIRLFWINAYQSIIWNQMASERIKRFGCNAVEGDLFMENGEIKFVTKDEIVDFKKIVLPLPGFNVSYPKNIIGDLYANVLKEDGVSFEKGSVPLESTAKGGYRKLVAIPSNFEWEPISDEGSCYENTKNSESFDASFKFSLPKASYATMFLRELMTCTISRESTYATN